MRTRAREPAWVASLIVRDSDGLPNENSETGKKLYSMLLAARLAGRPVNIVGKNTCVRWGDGEDIQSVSIAP